jgi:tRNA/rRNA methyltransferase
VDGASSPLGGNRLLTARVAVVLVGAKEDGNVGAVARVGRNFGIERMVLVRPRAALGSEARRRAMAGLALLKSARSVSTLVEGVADADLVIGTTDLVLGRSTAFLRRSIDPERLGAIVRVAEGRVALVFGPEDNGLGREELGLCDLIVHIPARREFPTLNLSHAVGILLYAIHRAQGPEWEETTPAPERLALAGREKEILLQRLGELMAQTDYPRHKRRGLMLLFRRLFGRAVPTEHEYRMMLGFVKSVHRIGKRRHG